METFMPTAAALTRRRLLRTALLTPLAAAAPTLAAQAAPKSRLIDAHWKRFGATDAVDHSAWAAFLARYRSVRSDGVAVVDYGAVTAEDRAALQAYLARLQAVRPTELTRAAAYAYWANLYNALTLELVLEAYPVSSILKVRGGWFGTGPWSDKVVTIEGREMSLDDVEHGVMRPVFRDPRIHYAVNCASIGCPNLLAEPFAGATLDTQLDAAARDFVNHPRGARVDRGRLYVSSIYDWFEEDFGGDHAGVIAHLKLYAAGDLETALAGISSITDADYDWTLNDAS